MPINVVHAEMKQAGHSREDQSMNVGWKLKNSNISIITMLPEPTDVMPTRKPAIKPIKDIQAKDFIVGGREAARSSIFFWKNKNVGMQISNTPTAIVMNRFTPFP
jgi:hypothetical protein